MKLHELKPNAGKTKHRTRVGRGTGSGRGKTSGRGTKGQGARTGGGAGPYHQGGNLPFYRSLPFKRGFNKPFQVTYNEVNLDQLVDFKANSEVNPETLHAAKLLRKPSNPVVLLGRGELKSALKVRVHRATAGAKAKVEKAGGSVELIAVVSLAEATPTAASTPATKPAKAAAKKTSKKATKK
jgi:large subunit ribosomal protein L15